MPFRFPEISWGVIIAVSTAMVGFGKISADVSNVSDQATEAKAMAAEVQSHRVIDLLEIHARLARLEEHNKITQDIARETREDVKRLTNVFLQEPSK